MERAFGIEAYRSGLGSQKTEASCLEIRCGDLNVNWGGRSFVTGASPASLTFLLARAICLAGSENRTARSQVFVGSVISQYADYSFKMTLWQRSVLERLPSPTTASVATDAAEDCPWKTHCYCS